MTSDRGDTPPGGPRRAAVRRVVLEVLLESAEARRFVDEALAARLDELPPRDRHLAQEIAYGAVRHENTLDHLLNAYLKVPVSRQRPHVGWSLRAGAYQLVYLERVPAHAAVDQTLEAVKALHGARKSEVGFANAVLHKLARDITRKTREPPADADDPKVLPTRGGHCHFSRPVLPPRDRALAEHLSVKHSHPKWLVKRWLARFGEEETRSMLEANNRTPPVWARVGRSAPSAEAVLESLREEGIEAEPGPDGGSIRLYPKGDLSQAAAFQRGWFQVQDLTAMRVGAVLEPPSNARVLDLCAAPGGKAAQLLEALGEGGLLVAADRGDEKLRRVRENLERVGSGARCRLVQVPDDPGEMRLEERFTHVLVDAPCSNTGVLGRRPDARWRIRPRDLQSLERLQQALLEAALRRLEPGGRLVYATCSIEPEENEERVAELLQSHPELVELESKLFLPHRAGGDGGFYSLIRRPASGAAKGA